MENRGGALPFILSQLLMDLADIMHMNTKLFMNIFTRNLMKIMHSVNLQCMVWNMNIQWRTNFTTIFTAQLPFIGDKHTFIR